MKHIKLKAIVWGVLTDLVVTLVGGVVVSVVIAIVLGLSGAPLDKEALVASMQSNTLILFTAFLVGLLGPFLGGYIAARSAKEHVTLNASLVGVVSLLLGLGNLWGAKVGGYAVDVFFLAGLFLTIPIAIAGSRVWLRARKSDTD